MYLQVVRGKTAALFSAATEVGGVIAGAPEDQVQALFTYGDALGIAFQIVDDLLDYGGSAAAIGKNTGDDFRERKLTLPVIKAVAKADAEERAFWTRVIEKGDQRDGDLAHAIALANEHGWKLGNCDVTLVCERPKIGPHAIGMQAKLAEIMGVAADRVSVKATTTEKLGFVGRREGIEAHAVVMLWPS